MYLAKLSMPSFLLTFSIGFIIESSVLFVLNSIMVQKNFFFKSTNHALIAASISKIFRVESLLPLVASHPFKHQLASVGGHYTSTDRIRMT